MKNHKNILSMVFLLVANFAFGCEACKLQQPNITRNFTHGSGPESQWDWLIVAVIAAITLYTFIYSLKFLIKPGEQDENHIKRTILDQKM